MVTVDCHHQITSEVEVIVRTIEGELLLHGHFRLEERLIVEGILAEGVLRLIVCPVFKVLVIFCLETWWGHITWESFVQTSLVAVDDVLG